MSELLARFPHFLPGPAKAVVLAVLFILLNTSSFGQRMTIGLHSEHTVAGVQYGAVTGIESKKQFGVGVFYQMDMKTPLEAEKKNTLYGIYLNAPLVKCDKLSFFGTLRGGLANEKFAVIIPGLETRINVGKRMAVAFGMSMRMNYPSVTSKVILKVF